MERVGMLVKHDTLFRVLIIRWYRMLSDTYAVVLTFTATSSIPHGA